MHGKGTHKETQNDKTLISFNKNAKTTSHFVSIN